MLASTAAVLALASAVASPAASSQPHRAPATAPSVLVYEMSDVVDGKQLIRAIRRRLHSSGVRYRTIRIVDEDRLEIEIPITGSNRNRQVEAVRQSLRRLDRLEFRIMANERDHPALLREALKQTSPDMPLRVGELVAWWAAMDEPQPVGKVPPLAKGQNARVQIVRDQCCAMRYRDKAERPGHVYFLVVGDRYNVGSKDMKHAEAAVGFPGLPAVAFTLKSDAGRRFYDLTYDNRPTVDGFKRHLAILLDDKIIWAPVLNDAIGSRGIIEGGPDGFTPDEMKNLIAVLKAGKLSGTIRFRAAYRVMTPPTTRPAEPSGP